MATKGRISVDFARRPKWTGKKKKRKSKKG